jgi:hypothetical protein
MDNGQKPSVSEWVGIVCSELSLSTPPEAPARQEEHSTLSPGQFNNLLKAKMINHIVLTVK